MSSSVWFYSIFVHLTLLPWIESFFFFQFPITSPLLAQFSQKIWRIMQRSRCRNESLCRLLSLRLFFHLFFFLVIEFIIVFFFFLLKNHYVYFTYFTLNYIFIQNLPRYYMVWQNNHSVQSCVLMVIWFTKYYVLVI